MDSIFGSSEAKENNTTLDSIFPTKLHTNQLRLDKNTKSKQTQIPNPPSLFSNSLETTILDLQNRLRVPENRYEMLSRALNGRKIKKSPRDGEGCSRSQSHNHEDEDCIVGLMGDLPLSFCDGVRDGTSNTTRVGLGLREVLQCSVQVMGESGLGISEKVVLSDKLVYAAKRFRIVTVSRKEFGRRVERLAQVSRGSDDLVPVRAYLYAKRIKLVLCDYFPMGSLEDLLTGARDLGHTPLDWDQRLKIVLHVARAIAYIHIQSPTEKNLQINVHGDIKASNVLIKNDLTACLSDYGFVQLAAEPPPPSEVLGVSQQKLPETNNLAEKLSQKSDIYSFGFMVLDMLAGPKATSQLHCVLEKKEEIKEGVIEFFEFFVQAGAKRKQALQVLDLALACTNRAPEARPSIRQIVLYLEEVSSTG